MMFETVIDLATGVIVTANDATKGPSDNNGYINVAIDVIGIGSLGDFSKGFGFAGSIFNIENGGVGIISNGLTGKDQSGSDYASISGGLGGIIALVNPLAGAGKIE